MKKYYNIIWDWNGTLLNDIDICVDIANEILKNHGNHQLTTESYKAAFGFPITDYYKKIGVDVEKESMEDLTKKFITNYMDGVKNCQLHEGAVSVLDHFKDHNIPQYILTAAHRDIVVELTQSYDISHYFKYIEGLDNHRAESKVQRGILLLQNNNISPAETIMIGDTDHDFEVAQAIGIDCVLVARGHQSKKRLLDAVEGHATVLNKISDLVDFLK